MENPRIFIENLLRREFPFQHELAGCMPRHAEYVARMEPGLLERLSWHRYLVFLADTRVPSAARGFLYFDSHK